MNNPKRSSDFTSTFKDILGLNAEQISTIDKNEFKLYKAFTWDRSISKKTFKFLFIKQILSVLSAEQIAKAKVYNIKQKTKIKQSVEDEYQRNLKYEKERLLSLKLSDDQLESYINIKNNRGRIYTETMKSRPEMKQIDPIEFELYFNQEHIYPIFNNEQIQQYKQIVKNEEIKFRIEKIQRQKLIFEHEYSIKLTDEQSKFVSDYEDVHISRDVNGDFISDFEREELKLNRMREILFSDQFDTYKIHFNKRIKRLEEELRKSNETHHIDQLNHIKQFLKYYINSVLPHKCKVRLDIEQELTLKQKELIKHIKEAYFLKLDDNKNKYKKHNIRYTRGLCNNELNNFLLRNDMNRIFPNTSFIAQFEPIKLLMTDALINLVKNHHKKLKKVIEKMDTFKTELYENNSSVEKRV